MRWERSFVIPHILGCQSASLNIDITISRDWTFRGLLSPLVIAPLMGDGVCHMDIFTIMRVPRTTKGLFLGYWGRVPSGEPWTIAVMRTIVPVGRGTSGRGDHVPTAGVRSLYHVS